MKRNKHLLWASFLTALILAGCGYTTGATLPGGYRTLHIPPFPNKIGYTENQASEVYVPLLEVKVRNAIEDRFFFDGKIRITREDLADMVLKGELVGFDRSPLRYTDDQDVQEYRIQISVNLILWDAHNNEVIWEEKGFVGEATYFISGPTATSESSAIEEATQDLGRRVVERAVENW